MDSTRPPIVEFAGWMLGYLRKVRLAKVVGLNRSLITSVATWFLSSCKASSWSSDTVYESFHREVLVYLDMYVHVYVESFQECHVRDFCASVAYSCLCSVFWCLKSPGVAVQEGSFLGQLIPGLNEAARRLQGVLKQGRNPYRPSGQVLAEWVAFSNQKDHEDFLLQLLS